MLYFVTVLCEIATVHPEMVVLTNTAAYFCLAGALGMLTTLAWQELDPKSCLQQNALDPQIQWISIDLF